MKINNISEMDSYRYIFNVLYRVPGLKYLKLKVHFLLFFINRKLLQFIIIIYYDLWSSFEVLLNHRNSSAVLKESQRNREFHLALINNAF